MTVRSTRSPWVACVLVTALALPNGALLGAQTQTQTAKPATAKPATTKPAASATPPPGTNADTGWPRTITMPSGTAIWYQPQIESWIDQKNLVAWSAVAYTPTGATKAELGTIKIVGPTKVALDDRVVNFNMEIAEYNFPSLKPEQVKTMVADVRARPSAERVLDLDRLVAYVADSPLQVQNMEGMKADPPKIFSSTTPAVLINLDGEPIWSPIKEVDLKFAVNTNWDLFQHVPTNTLYVRHESSWMQAADVKGPWAPVLTLPESFKKLPADDNWKEVKAAVPGKKLTEKTMPKVFVSQDPAELILVEGPPKYEAITGAGALLWVSNTEADVFRMGKAGDFYFLVAGRWFKSASLDGPWTFATPTLPEEFKKIPIEHGRSRVLASIPGTPQATEAILLASIPRTARVNKKDTKAPEVIYLGGAPEFKPIEGGTKGLEHAVNTDKDIIKFGDLYYMCFQGVWFISKSATGPWEVASSIPKEIYTIPTSSPVNHVTYVTVEDNDDEWVTFAYVAAYTGMMVAWGCVVWGSGWYYPPYRWYGGYYPGYYPYGRTYGMGAWYNPYSGAYGRGYAAYGPYGGVGMGSAYNPRTGTYARGATAYGPYGSRSYAEAYNPRTGTYGQTRQGSNVYGNWGTSTVQRGDNWAQTAHAENYRRGTETGAVRTSGGAAAVGREGPGGTQSGVVRTGSGDVYAGRDGNVYRKTEGGGWESSDGSGGWSSVEGGNRPSETGATRDRPTTGAAGTTGSGATAATRDRPTTTSTTRPTTPTTSQLERDKAARSAGNQTTTNRSNWQSSGASRAGASSMGGSRGGGGGGGGRRR